MADYVERELKPYKGYGITKMQELNFFGEKIGLPFYNVDDGEDYIGEEFRSLSDAKKFIDSLN